MSFSREALIESRESAWFLIPERETLLQRLSFLVTDPPRHRERSLALIGPANSGKSRLITQFMKMHPAVFGEELDLKPILLLRMSPLRNTSQLVDRLLALVTPVKVSGNEDARTEHLLNLLDVVGTRVIVLDEFHDVLSVGTQTRHHMLTKIKDLNNAGLRIVPVGTERMVDALSINPEPSTRFTRTKMDALTFEDSLGVALAFFAHLKLEEWTDTYQKAAEMVYVRTSGIIGNQLDVLEDVVLQATQSGAKVTSRLYQDTLERLGF
ncbi:TniB family NTP-binding protein [Deinococcus cellulosilyticus]|uniref:TniB protein n=1 Tax=Deinococcus cellulosilyticus (strain DSM 18568 / NBRC 106333 / KACC 11606 / 5516J-15) TaxID=1223518 RepID=A0A511N9P2_DEIC1|nr:TniB family NTP-binding protein [Deinococcus cellulosilyticus]GEM49553.1 hypothetical protein DC3_51880 [Deinococcus cellulosilyticus NBRC 106333 = KACC 11606]